MTGVLIKRRKLGCKDMDPQREEDHVNSREWSYVSTRIVGDHQKLGQKHEADRHSDLQKEPILPIPGFQTSSPDL